MNKPSFEQMPIKDSVNEKSKRNFEILLDFFEKEYFENILNYIDQAEKKGVSIVEVEKLLGVDIDEIKEYIDFKLSSLFEETNKLIRMNNVKLIENNSLRDVLGNSILKVFGRIIWVIENFNSENKKIKKKINNPESATRRIIKEYVERENKTGVATYYIDELCQDDEKLKMELSSENGYLQKFKDYFVDFESEGVKYKRYPTGGEKLPFFKFFSELEKGVDGKLETKEGAIKAMDNIRIKKIGRDEEENIINEDAVKKLIKFFFK